ncbi:MAG: M15 family metallopeptidase, partial [Clostridia bacterium]
PVPEDPFLILVNYDNPIPDGYEDTIELVKCGEKFVDSRIYDDLTAMMTEAQKYGSLWIASAFRDTATQESVLENAIVKRMSDYGWTREEATEDALLVIAQPGESEHNTGLAVDFNYVEYGFEDTAVYEWLSENCADYGFVERYTIDKEDITQINYEPWHYRYVGVENAQAMEELGMCLEEYVDYYYGNEE